VIIEAGPNDAEARFSDDRKHRYSLRRFITAERKAWRSVAFVMLNPSTADAFKLDPTVKRCVAFATRWGFDAVEVVNLFALRSPRPATLYAAAAIPGSPLSALGADSVNDEYITAVCARSELAIAAWGNHGDSPRLGARGAVVRSRLESESVDLYHLGKSNGGSPLHPLARGKSWIPADRSPVRWNDDFRWVAA